MTGMEAKTVYRNAYWGLPKSMADAQRFRASENKGQLIWLLLGAVYAGFCLIFSAINHLSDQLVRLPDGLHVVKASAAYGVILSVVSLLCVLTGVFIWRRACFINQWEDKNTSWWISWWAWLSFWISQEAIGQSVWRIGWGGDQIWAALPMLAVFLVFAIWGFLRSRRKQPA